MVRVMAGPQWEVREGPVGREGGEVMRPWVRAVGMRARSVAAVVVLKCIFEVVEMCVDGR
jgi:hypothetical protein